MFRAFRLPAVRLNFGAGSSPDRFSGLTKFGPFKLPENTRPTFGFVFPNEARDQANRLYLALKNGLGLFKGIEQVFRLSLTREQVFSVTGFSIASRSHHDAARIYADAIISWTRNNQHRPDLFFVLHPRTPTWEDDSPYYLCKALLLREGILSQGVTLDLLDSPVDLEWSVGNIALQAFAKLGGIPWTVGDRSAAEELILGIGRAHLFEPTARELQRRIAFTACYSSHGPFRFMTLTRVASNENEYLTLLQDVVRTAAERVARELKAPIVVHVPKEFGRQEVDAAQAGLAEGRFDEAPGLNVVRVNEEEDYFALDPTTPEGTPPRGMAIQTDDREYLLFAEGREERGVWRNRLPSVLRISPQLPRDLPPGRQIDLLRQVYDLSHANWRGFNARSKPITLHYGEIIARILAHIPASIAPELNQERARRVIENRMWFL